MSSGAATTARQLNALRGERSVQLDRLAALAGATGKQLRAGAGERLAKRAEERRLADHDPRFGVLDEVPEVLGVLAHAHRDRHGADPDRAHERDREQEGVVEHEQHPLFALHAELAQDPAHPRGLPEQLAVAERAVAAQVGRALAGSALDLPVDQQGDVGVARRVDAGSPHHCDRGAVSLPVPASDKTPPFSCRAKSSVISSAGCPPVKIR